SALSHYLFVGPYPLHLPHSLVLPIIHSTDLHLPNSLSSNSFISLASHLLHFDSLSFSFLISFFSNWQPPSSAIFSAFNIGITQPDEDGVLEKTFLEWRKSYWRKWMVWKLIWKELSLGKQIHKISKPVKGGVKFTCI
ncbi:NADPH--cytochrome P450 reductase, partial [Bienertia sinuspersici]